MSTGQVVNEIPDTFVSESVQEHQFILVPNSSDEQLQITGVGIDQGPYRVGIIYNSERNGGLIEHSAIGETTVGQDYRFSVDTRFPQETGGYVVVEAEHFTWNFNLGGRAWITQTVLTGYVGSSYLNVLPDTDLRLTGAFTTTSPQLRYTVNFSTTGLYYVWLRGYAPNAAGDSVYISLDDQPPTTLTGFVPRIWSWTNKDTQGNSVIIEVTEPGVYTLSLWQREDGLRLDRVVLTTDSDYTPTGSGPPESERFDSSDGE